MKRLTIPAIVVVTALPLMGGSRLIGAAATTKTVLVSVVATAAAPVIGLTAGDIRIQEDKTPLEVRDVVAATDPLSVVLLLDTTDPMGGPPRTQDLRRAVSAFISTVRASAADTQFSILAISNGALTLTDFTNNRAQLDDAVNHIVVLSQTGSAMLEGVVSASQSLEPRSAPRRAIVAVSLGAAEAGREQPTAVLKELQKSGATLWAVMVASSSDVAQAAARDEAWKKIAPASGGMELTGVAISGLESQMRTIGNTLVSQYSVTFARKDDGAVKQLTGETTKGAKILFSRWMH